MLDSLFGQQALIEVVFSDLLLNWSFRFTKKNHLENKKVITLLVAFIRHLIRLAFCKGAEGKTV